MLLDRIDIDVHGPLHHVELGPFSEHLNVISGPLGSGKTAIARFIRDSLIQRDYPQGMFSASSGRVVWADRNGLVHCRREQDGTVAGRRTVEFESRGEPPRQFHCLDQSWFGDLSAGSDSSRAIQTLQLPESIVDCVITDTAISSVARVVSACVRSGLDSPETYQSLPLHDDSTYHRRDPYSPLDPVSDGIDQRDYDHHRRLRQQLADIDAELSRLLDDERSTADRTFDTFGNAQSMSWSLSQRQQRLLQLHERARQLQARQSELRRWVAEIDRELAHTAAGAAEFDSAECQFSASITDQNLRHRLQDLDAQMIRWRRALAEVRGLRDTFSSDQHRQRRADGFADRRETLRRESLNGFLYTVDHYDHPATIDDWYSDPARWDDRSDEIEFRIDSATRHIDWLLKRYADPTAVPFHWYDPLPETAAYPAAASLAETLRQIRDDLCHLRSPSTRGESYARRPSTDDLDELCRSEQWLHESIRQLNRHRESLLRDAAKHQDASAARWAREGRYDCYVLLQDRRDSLVRLQRVTEKLQTCLRQAADVRRSMRHLPIIDRQWSDDFYRHSIEGRSCGDDYSPANVSVATQRRIDSLRRRRTEILSQLRVVDRPVVSRSPLSDAASGWLVRLTGGRLRRVAWPYNRFRDDRRSYHRDSDQRSGVTIDGREEHDCSIADRAVTVVAVRMAAADLLARTGRHVPLILETDGDDFGAVRATHQQYAPLAYYDNGDLTRSNGPIASALRDFTRAGRQVVLFTSNQPLAAELSRVGARSYRIHRQPIIHAHRPLWKPHYEAERYVGPHPHTYGYRGADELLNHDRFLRDATPGPVHESMKRNRPAPSADINRDFDTAWREAYGMYDCVDRGGVSETSERTDWSRDGIRLRDGYYVANSYTTNHESVDQGCCDGPSSGQPGCCNHQKPKAIAQPISPFFLTVDSPIDQAPSIDAVAAARLRGLKVTHINHLMQQDSNRLADALGLVNVDASTIRRWQAECRLVCRVPQLRGFDARVLVGCGVTTPAQLAAIHPVDLLQQVEAFLSTNQGQKILLSGSSHELSRITTWIAEANSGERVGDTSFARDRRRSRAQDLRRADGGSIQVPVARADSDNEFDSLRYEYESGARGIAGRRSSLRSGRRPLATSRGGKVRNRSVGFSSPETIHTSTAYDSGGGSVDPKSRGSRVSGRSLRSRSSRGSSRRSNAGGTPSNGSGSRRPNSRDRSNRPSGDARVRAASQRQEYPARDYELRQYDARLRESKDEAAHQRSERKLGDDQSEWRFFLQRDSLIVDAPSIGARMAERLNAIGIFTVDDLLNADAQSVASELDHRRVDADTVLQWQQQAALVCRVPMLRGHDAQLLVAAEVTTPEELAQCDPNDLFPIVDTIARSAEGKRIIRNGKRPDLAEVTDWINYGNQHRQWIAA